MLGIFPITIKQYGAVSKETAMEMAHGALAPAPKRAFPLPARASPARMAAHPTNPSASSTSPPSTITARCSHRDMHYGEIGRAAVRFATVKTALEMMLKLA